MIESLINKENSINDDSSPKKLYYQSMKKNPVLSHEDEKELAEQFKKGDKKARDKFILSNLGFVIMTAVKYRNPKIPLNDIIQEASIGLIKAVDRFNHTLNTRFSTYAVFWIKQAIFHLIYDQSSMIHIPQNKIEKYIRLHNKINEFNYTDIDKMVDGVDENEYNQIKSMVQDYIQIDYKTDEQKYSLKDTLVDENQLSILDDYIEDEMFEALYYYIGKLKLKEKFVIINRYGLFNHKQLSLQKIADKLNTNKENIRQIEIRAIKKLKCCLENQNFSLEK